MRNCDDSKIHCSELVTIVLQEIGFIPYTINATNVSPMEIAGTTGDVSINILESINKIKKLSEI